jgi:hypothetical protein
MDSLKSDLTAALPTVSFSQTNSPSKDDDEDQWIFPLRSIRDISQQEADALIAKFMVHYSRQENHGGPNSSKPTPSTPPSSSKVRAGTRMDPGDLSLHERTRLQDKADEHLQQVRNRQSLFPEPRAPVVQKALEVFESTFLSPEDSEDAEFKRTVIEGSFGGSRQPQLDRKQCKPGCLMIGDDVMIAPKTQSAPELNRLLRAVQDAEKLDAQLRDPKKAFGLALVDPKAVDELLNVAWWLPSRAIAEDHVRWAGGHDAAKALQAVLDGTLLNDADYRHRRLRFPLSPSSSSSSSSYSTLSPTSARLAK